ncbi:putative ABC transport system permease protein [Methanolinea mesophila]|uniref:ABC transporter permease n=1 Tax=Methanolinea mesophila TaxID=547055 RepID=UPI001AE736D1|nr:putative ABC transport system permease protein [Methanolinea mesophila]
MTGISLLSYIVAGVRNKPGRNLATAFCFAFIAANLFAGQYLFTGAAGSADQGIARMGADQIVVPSRYLVFFRGNTQNNTAPLVRAEASTFRIGGSVMEDIREVDGIAAVSPQVYITSLQLPHLSDLPVDVFGIDPSTDFTIRPWLRRPLAGPVRPGDVIVGSGIRTDATGRIRIGKTEYTVVGTLDPTQSPVDRTVFMTLDDAYALALVKGALPENAPSISRGDINAAMIRLEPGADSAAIATRIRMLFPATYLAVVERHFSLDPASQEIRGVPALLNLVSVVVVVAALPLIALIAAMAARERQREIGLLRSMGARKRVIFFLVISESLFLAAAGGLAGVAASVLLLSGMNSAGILTRTFAVSAPVPDAAGIGAMAGVALLVVIAIGSIAALYPAYQSSMMNPYDAIRNEG